MNAMVLGTAPADPARVPAAVLAVLVHLLLFGFLFFGVRWSSTAPEAVVVELWTQPPQPEVAPVQPAPPPPPPPPPKPEPAPKAVIKPAPPKPAPEVRKPDIALEKDKQARKPPPKSEARPEAKPVPKPEPKLELDARSRMQEQLARETKALADERTRREAASKTAAPPPSAPVIDNSYAAKIRAKIRGNLALPPDIPGDPEAIFEVIQLPTGEVIEATLRKSSGNKAIDEAIERAIRKSSPLPKPDRADQVPRRIEIKFRPKDPL